MYMAGAVSFLKNTGKAHLIGAWSVSSTMSRTSGGEHIPMSATERTRSRRCRISTEERRRHAEERRAYEMQRRQSDPAIREQHS
ncbi:hypothetical protein Aduo_001942 [Ancylostoma duodenale]